MSIDFGTDIYEEPIVAKTFLSEDAQEGSLRPKTLQEYIGQEMSLYSFFIWLERQEESRYSDRKHANQRYLGWFHRIGNHQHYGE